MAKFQDSEIVVGGEVIVAYWNPETGEVAHLRATSQAWDAVGTYDGELEATGACEDGDWYEAAPRTADTVRYINRDAISNPEMIRRIAEAGGTGPVVESVWAQYGADFSDEDRELV